jgi:aspartate/methionine/tyrosine aminotransferase
VLVHSGAEEAIFTFMHGVLKAGDQVIVHSPSYQSLSELPRGIGCDVSLWRATHENRWQLDLDELESMITPKCRLIIVNTPHNPTGYHMPKGEFDRLIVVARKHGIILFVDEVYRGLEPEAQLRLPSIADEYERGVSLNVMSKSYGLAGLRIGWIASRDTALLDAAAQVKDYTTICCSAPSERLARLALSVGERLIEANRNRIRENLPLLEAAVARHRGLISMVAPIAGPVAFPVLDASIPVDRFCEDALQHAGVLLLPGTVFDSSSNAFRVGLGRKSFPEGLEAFERFLSASDLWFRP